MALRGNSKAGFADLPGWQEDDHLAAFVAFRRSALQALKKPYRDGSDGRTFARMLPVFQIAATTAIEHADQARQFFETHFNPVQIGNSDGQQGLVTGFYEPVVDGSRRKSDRFPVPIYRVPPDLVEVDDTTRPASMDPYFRFARKSAAGLGYYPDRGEIERGYLAGRGLELVFVADKVEAFFIHVQGAARIRLENEADMSITYAAKTGHPFTGPGRILLERGDVPQSEMSMQAIRQWLHRNPDKADELLWQNRSFIFFKDAPVADPALGPVAAAKVQLAGGRSMAVDREKHVFGSAFYVAAPKVNFGDNMPFQRLMVAQDTGSAILGEARGDLFTGSGQEAGEIAGRIKAEAQFWLLVPVA
ncbi:MAG: murein transglycosylase A [Rhizobiaceae bacterium]